MKIGHLQEHPHTTGDVSDTITEGGYAAFSAAHEDWTPARARTHGDVSDTVIDGIYTEFSAAHEDWTPARARTHNW